jgi:kynurenine formamidase
MFFTEIIDLSQPLYTGMPCYAANIVAFYDVDTYESSRRVSEGRRVMNARMMLLSEHTGTHLDAPSHFDEHGTPVDELALEQLLLPGHLLDLTHKRAHEPIGPDDLMAAEEASGIKVGPGKAVIVYTGEDENWGKPGFFYERPYVTGDGAQWLVDRGITLFGTDLIAIDDPDDVWEATHTTFLGNGVPQVQQLNNLGQLVGKSFTFVVLPLPMRGGSGSPVRPVALVHA